MAYCPTCGIEVSSPADTRFGEVFCSPGHAEAFVEKVQVARAQAAAHALEASGIAQPPQTLAVSAPGRRDWKGHVKMGACIGAPVLALVFLVGGGGAVLGWAGALVPVLAFLACPLAMYFLMRSMTKTGHPGDQQNRGQDR
jgi:hypothetical protein